MFKASYWRARYWASHYFAHGPTVPPELMVGPFAQVEMRRAVFVTTRRRKT